ncbi:MAG: 50S ribosomal protein L17 [Planctomycetaceae bacterium]|nr:50S ribosomal protein L17 [Planctomycetaceae bacterium]
MAGGQLNRTSAHRVALRRNLAASLFEHETISTTMPKAKHVKSFVEKLITLAKKGDLAARRRAIALLGNRNIVEEVDGEVKKKGTVIGKLFSEIGPRYLDRAGGYTRIIKLAKTRLGDNSPLVLLQLVGQESKPEAAGKSGKKKASKKKTSKSEKTEE